MFSNSPNLTTIHHILAEFREAQTSSRDLGDLFEHLILAYLKADPIYRDRFRNVWLWMDWPRREGRPDTGIDLVAEERATGGYCAIQCKFYGPQTTLDKKDIDSFFTESGREPFTSRIIVSTTDRWTTHAEESIKNQIIPVTRLSVRDLDESPIDWSRFSLKTPDRLGLKPKKQIRPHQALALEKVMEGFKVRDRGKLIMACGTGKTYTSLKIAEQMVVDGAPARVLFMVPSISLLSQTLREWTAEATVPLHSIAVCSDTKVGKRRKKDDSDDIDIQDLAFPATTDAQTIAARAANLDDQGCLTVVFSTYQSIKAVADAQKKGLPEFDLILCDEAHRTTGVTLAEEEESAFVRVHDQDFIKGRMRLYMTATPRLYGDAAKSKALENDMVVCSMDDPNIYGPEFHRLGFGEAVRDGLLTDYKVMVLVVDEQYVSGAFQRQLAGGGNELQLEDAAKIIGCWNGLSKRIKDDSGHNADTIPMRRAVAFCRSIKESENLVKNFKLLVDAYKQDHPDEEVLDCELDHVDGTQNSLERNTRLDWLKADTSDQGQLCRILSNARCLSEGVDVPALDAVMFLTPKNSVVDVVQSVGRVMRKAPGKDYGYIILPVGIPAGMTPEEALKDNDRYRVVWQILQALRAHDDRFNAIINKLELNDNRPPQIDVIGVGGGQPGDVEQVDGRSGENRSHQMKLEFPDLENWREAIYAKVVQRCGDRRYWEEWAGDIAKIAENHITRIQGTLAVNAESRETFSQFLTGLRQNINPKVTEAEAIEMLAQHLITKPVFDALFEGYAFAEQNPVSQVMQQMVDVLEGKSIGNEAATLEKFYASVRERAKGVDNVTGKQRIVVELYDKFFRGAFPRLTDRLGIVYTPVEVVDFIVKSADQALRQEFGTSLTNEGVHILDPFTGTGTFMVRLLQKGLIQQKDLERKFKHELHANEIVLLAYYIAAINIEEAYHGLKGGNYQPFEGIILTDTFQMNERDGTLLEEMFPENNRRVANQKTRTITVIIGNPPYSSGQKSANDNNQNLKYTSLDKRISYTYIAKSLRQTGKSKAYDSYIRAIRWASDRIENDGIICFVTNGSFIDNNAMDGLRKCFVDEFSKIYCFNLRGNQRTSGETSRQEGGKIFGSGSRAGIAITLLVKKADHTKDCEIYYHDIGDYLTREQKLDIIQKANGIEGINWERVIPNSTHDWINQRDPIFEEFIPLGDKSNESKDIIFDVYSMGVKTNRDNWVYNFDKNNITEKIREMIDFFNAQSQEYKSLSTNIEISSFISMDSCKIKWTEDLIKAVEQGKTFEFNSKLIRQSIYRPFCKQWLFYSKEFNWTHHLMPSIFPTNLLDNFIICVTGVGVVKEFSAFISNLIPDLCIQGAATAGQCFPLYTYTKQSDLGTLFQSDQQSGYTRNENIPDAILEGFQATYGDKAITKEDIFYYVYGVLHSPEYKSRFAADLKKMLPRIPYTQDFWAFSRAGRSLAHWHLNYETIEPYPLEEYKENLFLEAKDYRVEKMVFGRHERQIDKTTIIYNSKIRLAGIPLRAYEYKVCDRSAIEWIMERYQITKDKASGIVNEPNTWSDDPHYIVDLVKRIVRVSLKTVDIVRSLPPLNELNG